MVAIEAIDCVQHMSMSMMPPYHRIIPRAVKDGDADLAVRVHVGMPHVGRKLHHRGLVRVILRERHRRLEKSTLAAEIRETRTRT